jgi:hypothetical protein
MLRDEIHGWPLLNMEILIGEYQRYTRSHISFSALLLDIGNTIPRFGGDTAISYGLAAKEPNSPPTEQTVNGVYRIRHVVAWGETLIYVCCYRR